jgi:hypothetical protein
VPYKLQLAAARSRTRPSTSTTSGASRMTDATIRVRFDEEAHSLPFAEFMNNFDDNTWYDHTRLFCIVPHTACHLSMQSNEKDPWYYTERDRNSSGDFQVRRGRPVLVCSQNDTWSHSGHSVPNVANLSDLTQPDRGGLKLDEFFWKHLLQSVFGPPSVIAVANTLGYTALASSVQYIAYQSLVDLTAASIQSDLERVVLATLVHSRDVVRNTAFVSDQSGGALKNLAMNASTQRVPDSAADFVVSSANVNTLSVRVLIATPVVCAVLWGLVAIHGVWSVYSVPASGVPAVSWNTMNRTTTSATTCRRRRLAQGNSQWWRRRQGAERGRARPILPSCGGRGGAPSRRLCPTCACAADARACPRRRPFSRRARTRARTIRTRLIRSTLCRPRLPRTRKNGCWRRTGARPRGRSTRE